MVKQIDPIIFLKMSQGLSLMSPNLGLSRLICWAFLLRCCFKLSCWADF
jgi:hypothetical protein